VHPGAYTLSACLWSVSKRDLRRAMMVVTTTSRIEHFVVIFKAVSRVSLLSETLRGSAFSEGGDVGAGR
jgi:hypothetical protein